MISAVEPKNNYIGRSRHRAHETTERTPFTRLSQQYMEVSRNQGHLIWTQTTIGLRIPVMRTPE